MLLTRQQILEQKERRYEIVPIKEWGGDVRIQSLLANEVLSWRERLTDKNGEYDKRNERGMLQDIIVRCAVDEAGTRIFTRDDVKELGLKDFVPVKNLAKRCLKFNGLNDDDEENNYDEILGNFEETPEESELTT